MNTRDIENGIEELATPEALREALLRIGVLGDDRPELGEGAGLLMGDDGDADAAAEATDGAGVVAPEADGSNWPPDGALDGASGLVLSIVMLAVKAVQLGMR